MLCAMKPHDWFWGLVEAVIWYCFIYYFLYVLKTDDVELWKASLVLLALVYVGTISCPWFRNTNAWKKLWGK